MKNIKVNIINVSGKPSSTTLSYVICEAYYDIFNTTEDHIRDIKDSLSDGFNLRPAITTLAQEFTNAYIKKVQKENGWLGVSQYGIEKAMIVDIAGANYPY